MPAAAISPPTPTPAPASKPAVVAPARAVQPVQTSAEVRTTKIDAGEPTDHLSDIAADLQDLDNSGQPDGAPKRGKDGKFEKPPAKSADEPAPVKPGDEPIPAAKDEPKPGTMRALGKAYDELKENRDKVLQPKIQSLESKLAEQERTLTELRKAQPDVKPIQAQLEAIQKENATLKEEIRFVNYEKHPEYVEKYQKPYEEAWTKANHEITQLTLQTEDGQTRKASANDLLALANAPLDQLDDLAEAWFGKSAPRVIRHVERIRDLAEAQEKAKIDVRKGAGEYATKQTEAQKQHSATLNRIATEMDADLVKKYPKWFGKDETDAEGNATLDKGLAYVDSVRNGTPQKMPDGTTRTLTPEEKVKRLSVIRMKAANHDRLAIRLKARDARIAELEKSLADFEKSEPGGEGREPGGVSNKPWEDQVADELKALDK